MENDVNTAIDQSIAKWEKNYNILLDAKSQNKATPELAMGVESCPLCGMFYFDDTISDNCSNCPIQAKTGLTHCEGSPYIKALNYWEVLCDTYTIPDDELLQAFKDEIDFLKSLERQHDEK